MDATILRFDTGPCSAIRTWCYQGQLNSLPQPGQAAVLRMESSILNAIGGPNAERHEQIQDGIPKRLQHELGWILLNWSTRELAWVLLEFRLVSSSGGGDRATCSSTPQPVQDRDNTPEPANDADSPEERWAARAGTHTSLFVSFSTSSETHLRDLLAPRAPPDGGMFKSDANSRNNAPDLKPQIAPDDRPPMSLVALCGFMAANVSPLVAACVPVLTPAILGLVLGSMSHRIRLDNTAEDALSLIEVLEGRAKRAPVWSTMADIVLRPEQLANRFARSILFGEYFAAKMGMLEAALDRSHRAPSQAKSVLCRYFPLTAAYLGPTSLVREPCGHQPANIASVLRTLVASQVVLADDSLQTLLKLELIGATARLLDAERPQAKYGRLATSNIEVHNSQIGTLRRYGLFGELIGLSERCWPNPNTSEETHTHPLDLASAPELLISELQLAHYACLLSERYLPGPAADDNDAYAAMTARLCSVVDELASGRGGGSGFFEGVGVPGHDDIG